MTLKIVLSLNEFYLFLKILLTHHFSVTFFVDRFSGNAWSRAPAVTPGKMSFHNPGLATETKPAEAPRSR